MFDISGNNDLLQKYSDHGVCGNKFQKYYGGDNFNLLQVTSNVTLITVVLSTCHSAVVKNLPKSRFDFIVFVSTKPNLGWYCGNVLPTL